VSLSNQAKDKSRGPLKPAAFLVLNSKAAFSQKGNSGFFIFTNVMEKAQTTED